MCGDSHLPAAPESADLIAIIHPHPSSSIHSPTEPRMSLFHRGGRLRLSNRADGTTKTTFQYHAGDDDSDQTSESSTNNEVMLNVRIHKYGQPLFSSPRPMARPAGSDTESDSSDSDEEPKNPILHSFLVDPATRDSISINDSLSSLENGLIRLNLGVGGDGVVGRTVSIVELGRQKILGEGVIGRS